jgi:hypothetical protein
VIRVVGDVHFEPDEALSLVLSEAVDGVVVDDTGAGRSGTTT